MQNVEALTQNESSDQYPRYKNVTDKTSYNEFRTEYKGEDHSVIVEYKRTCTGYYTYCKHTGNEDDICYGSLNKKDILCGDWQES